MTCTRRILPVRAFVRVSRMYPFLDVAPVYLTPRVFRATSRRIDELAVITTFNVPGALSNCGV